MSLINVDLEKPELGIAVIVHLKHGFTTVGYRKIDGNSYAWQLFGDTEFIINENDYVTHWEILPKNPNNL